MRSDHEDALNSMQLKYLTDGINGIDSNLWTLFPIVPVEQCNVQVAVV